MSQVFNLLAGSAKTWFQLERKNIRTWSDFERKIKENFLTSTHDNEWFAKATKRKQGKQETVASYINQMRVMMQGMSEPLSEKYQLSLIRRNLRPRYTAIVASHCPQTIADVLRIAKEVENFGRYDMETEAKPKPKYRDVNTIDKTSDSSSDADSDCETDNEVEEARVLASRADGPKNAKTDSMTEPSDSQSQ